MAALIPTKQTRKVTISGTATAAASITDKQLILKAKTTDVLIAFGGASVAASVSVDGSGYYTGDVVIVFAGSSEVWERVDYSHTHYSAIALDGSTAGALYVLPTNGEV